MWYNRLKRTKKTKKTPGLKEKTGPTKMHKEAFLHSNPNKTSKEQENINFEPNNGAVHPG